MYTKINSRKDDSIILIAQDNADKKLEIVDVNENLSQLLGFKNKELIGHDLRDFVAEEVGEILNENLEFKDFSAELDEVLIKINNFALKNRAGEKLRLFTKIVRDVSEDEKSRFSLILNKQISQSHEDKILESMINVMRGHEVLDDALLIPNYESTLKNIDIAASYASLHNIGMAFAIINFEGGNADDNIMSAIDVCDKNLRKRDIIGLISDNNLALVLTNITESSIQPVVERLRASMQAAVGNASDVSATYTAFEEGFDAANFIAENINLNDSDAAVVA